MLLQLHVGPVADRDRLRRQWERWRAELGPAADGWLGSTAGLAGDHAVVVHLFTSGEAAAAAAGRPDHRAWWSAGEAALAGPAAVLQTGDVTVQHQPDPGNAGFVQVMVASVPDRAGLEQVEAEIGPDFVAFRPDFLGGYRAWFPDGTLAAVDYFRSEADARAGESRPMSPALQSGFQRWMSFVHDPEWHDIADPWPASPP